MTALTLSQKQINDSIEVLMRTLTKKADAEKFASVIQKNVDSKRLSTKTETEFFDRLMLNITYFVEYKKVWMDLLHQLFNAVELPSVTSIETKALQQQMVIRETIAKQMDEYTAIFHNQYTTLNVTSEDVIYDYAYASVEHSLRFDFLSFLLLQQNAQNVFTGDEQETISIMDGYVAYYADQFVNQMELK